MRVTSTKERVAFRTFCLQHGYAIAIHGSMTRDLDLIAAPWTDEATSAEELVEAVADRIGAFIEEPPRSPTQKPHGRLAWSLILCGSGYIDLSVMSRIQ